MPQSLPRAVPFSTGLPQSPIYEVVFLLQLSSGKAKANFDAAANIRLRMRDREFARLRSG
jgi:hypothetical protein